MLDFLEGAVDDVGKSVHDVGNSVDDDEPEKTAEDDEPENADGAKIFYSHEETFII